MNDSINRQMEDTAHIISLLSDIRSRYNYFDPNEIEYYHALSEAIKALRTAQSEPSIPLSWFDEQIERLKDLDNAFATLTAMQISGMVKKWSDEQNE